MSCLSLELASVGLLAWSHRTREALWFHWNDKMLSLFSWLPNNFKVVPISGHEGPSGIWTMKSVHFMGCVKDAFRLRFLVFCSGLSAILALRQTFFRKTWPLAPWWSSRRRAQRGEHSPCGCLTSRGAPTRDKAKKQTKPTPPYTPQSIQALCR